MCGRRAESVHEDRYATGDRGDTELTNEAFARIKIDQLLKDAAWRLTDGRSVRYEYPLDDGGRADYVLFDRLGRAVAVLEAKSTSVSLTAVARHHFPFGSEQALRFRAVLSEYAD